MSDGYIVLDDLWKIRIHMDHRQVLNIDIISDNNRSDIPTEHNIEPDTALITNSDVSDYFSSFRDIDVFSGEMSLFLIINDHR